MIDAPEVFFGVCSMGPPSSPSGVTGVAGGTTFTQDNPAPVYTEPSITITPAGAVGVFQRGGGAGIIITPADPVKPFVPPGGGIIIVNHGSVDLLENDRRGGNVTMTPTWVFDFE